MPDDVNKYSNMIPQTIESSGNFINNVKNPSFVLAVLMLVGFGYLIYVITNTQVNLLINSNTQLMNSNVQLTSKIDSFIATVNKITDKIEKREP